MYCPLQDAHEHFSPSAIARITLYIAFYEHNSTFIYDEFHFIPLDWTRTMLYVDYKGLLEVY